MFLLIVLLRICCLPLIELLRTCVCMLVLVIAVVNASCSCGVAKCSVFISPLEFPTLHSIGGEILAMFHNWTRVCTVLHSCIHLRNM